MSEILSLVRLRRTSTVHHLYHLSCILDACLSIKEPLPLYTYAHEE